MWVGWRTWVEVSSRPRCCTVVLPRETADLRFYYTRRLSRVCRWTSMSMAYLPRCAIGSLAYPIVPGYPATWSDEGRAPVLAFPSSTSTSTTPFAHPRHLLVIPSVTLDTLSWAATALEKQNLSVSREPLRHVARKMEVLQDEHFRRRLFVSRRCGSGNSEQWSGTS